MMRKKMMKRVTAVLAGVVLAIGLMACGSQGSGNNTAEVRQEEEGVTSENTQESSALPEQETGDQSDAVQVQQETTSQTEQQAEGDMDAFAEDTDQTSTEGGKTLVVYYSATGNTERVAGYIAAATDADIFVLEPVEPYSSEDLDWTDKDSRVTREHDNEDERNVELVSSTVDNWESYDTVFIGYPNWWADLPIPVYTFLEEYDFDGKTIIPFVTHGGSGFSGTVSTISELQPDALVSENTLSLSRNDVAGSEEDVAAWAESLGLN